MERNLHDGCPFPNPTSAGGACRPFEGRGCRGPTKSGRLEDDEFNRQCPVRARLAQFDGALLAAGPAVPANYFERPHKGGVGVGMAAEWHPIRGWNVALKL